ncbi:dentin sialophosphoprotein-like [Engraulis encrasicolus]|uniref:dentin sialophosphoprotein-like n=1 Tax=Engraulis encrasicolus TaxID=184585 RepID=UPI002FD6B45E
MRSNRASHVNRNGRVRMAQRHAVAAVVAVASTSMPQGGGHLWPETHSGAVAGMALTCSHRAKNTHGQPTQKGASANAMQQAMQLGCDGVTRTEGMARASAAGDSCGGGGRQSWRRWATAVAAEGDSRGGRGRQLWRQRATVRVASRQGICENTVTVCQRLQVGKTGPTTPPGQSTTCPPPRARSLGTSAIPPGSVVFEGLGWVALDDIKIVDGISPEDCQASTLLPHLGSTPTSPSSHPGASQGPSDPVSASEPPPERTRPDWTATSSSETSRTPNSTDSSPGNGSAGDASPTGASSGPEHPTGGGTSEESRTPGVEDRASVDPAPSPDSFNLDNAPSPDDSENSDDSDSVVRFPDTSSPDSSSPLMPKDKDDIDPISNTDGDESKTPFDDNNDNVSDKNLEGGMSFDNSNDDGDYEDDDDSDSDNISGRSSTTPVLRTLDPILITIIAMSALGVLLGSVCGVLLYCACGTEEDGEDGTEEQPSEAQKRVLQNYNFELVKKKNKKNATNTQQLQEKDTMKEFTEV